MTTTAKFPAATLAQSDLDGPVPNFGTLVLQGNLTAGSASIQATTDIPTYWPQPGRIVIDSEIIKYSTYAADTFSGLTRGQESDNGGSAAAVHNSGASIGFRHTAYRQNQLDADLIALEAEHGKGADLVSAATVDLSLATGGYCHVTGVVTITAFGTLPAGRVKVLEFDGILTLTHNAASLILRAGANATTAAGDIYAFVSEGGGNWRELWHLSSSATPNVQTFTVTGTWNKPSGAKAVRVICFGPGGSGGGGVGGAAGSVRSGAASGGGGAYSTQDLDPSALGSTEAVTVGTAGAVGTGGSSANGTDAAAGSDTTFGTHVKACAGGPGQKGINTGANQGGGGGGGSVSAGAIGSTTTGGNGGNPAGTAGSANTVAGVGATFEGGGGGGGGARGGGPGANGGGGGAGSDGAGGQGLQGGQSIRGGGAGGSGGGLNAGNTETTGGTGGLSGATSTWATGGGGAAGAVNGGAGAPGTSRSLTGKAGDGGGGGGAQDSGTGGVGGAGGVPGGGGGGGAGGTVVGGAGGLGGRGEVIVITWF